MRNGQLQTSRTHAAGFSLIELMVALTVTVLIVLAVLALFDFNSRLTRVQTNVADMQQSLRIAQYDIMRLMRMSGRGGLQALQPGAVYPTGAAIAVRDDVAAGQRLSSGDPETAIAEGTDVLTVRGVFAGQVYQLKKLSPSDSTAPKSFDYTYSGAPPAEVTPALATGGYIDICAQAPSGVTHNLQPLIDRITALKTDALILLSDLSDQVWAVVELDPNNSLAANAPSCAPVAGVRLAFRVTAGTHVAEYRALSTTAVGENLPSTLTRPVTVGLLEEYRFYIRDVPSSDETRLARAQYYPGTEAVYNGDAQNLRVDVADDILDLQVALGVDVDNDGRIAEDVASRTTDEWFLNAPADNIFPGRLFYARVTTLARTARPDRGYEAPLLLGIENHSYSTSDPDDPVNGGNRRMHRRRQIQTIVGLRNL